MFVAGPGFINVRLNKNIITEKIKIIFDKDGDYGKNNFGNGKKAIVEFVSANPTGPLTVAHGRGAIVGDTISRILEWNGYQVDREYYFNNAGRQMRKLGESVRARYLNICNVDSSFQMMDIKVNILMKLQNHFKMNLVINILVKIILISLKILLKRKYLKISKEP